MLSVSWAFTARLRLSFQDDAPSKPVLQPYKRLSAQEVCYQRMHTAQQQAAQLSAAAKAAQSTNPPYSGEKKRIAHRPNPQKTSLKTSEGPHFSFHFFIIVLSDNALISAAH